MASLADIVESSGWKKFMAKLYGWGASVVIIGALVQNSALEICRTLPDRWSVDRSNHLLLLSL